MRSPYYFYLPFAIICLAITLILNALHQNNEPAKEYLQKVNTNLQLEVGKAESAMTQLKKQLLDKKNLNFGELLQANTYPVFIYQNDELKFWTDNRFKIESESILGKFSQISIENNHGIFIVLKDSAILGENRYQMAMVVPLFVKARDNQYVKASLNQDIFLTNDIRISLEQDEGYPIKSKEGRTLFTIALPISPQVLQAVSVGFYHSAISFFSLLTLLFTFLQIRLNLKEFLRQEKVLAGFIMLSFSVFSIRLMMLFFDIPVGLKQFDLFGIKFYSSSFVTPSLGDLLLNMIVLSILGGFIYLNYHVLLPIKKLLACPQWLRKIISVILVLFTYLAFYFLFANLESIYFSSQTSLDITSDINFNTFKVACFFIFLLSALLYFFTSHVVSRLLFFLNSSPKQILILIIIASLIFIPTTIFLSVPDMLIFMLNFLYLAVISLVKLPKNVKKLGYTTYLYLCFSTIVAAMLGSYSIYTFEKTMDSLNKNLFANQLLIENDKHGEFLLNNVIKEIKQDQMIKTRMVAVLSKDLIIQKIKRYHLSSYFDKYDLNVLLFNDLGEPYNYDQSYDSMFTKFHLDKYKTDYKDIYFVQDLTGNTKRYLVFMEIARKDQQIGKIVLDLRLKKILPNSIYPNLFLDKRFANIYDDSDVSYAIYRNNLLSYTYGDFNYEKKFLKLFISDKNEILEREIFWKDHRHLLIEGDNNRYVVISSAFSPMQSLLSNFSFLFIILFVFKLFMATLYYFYVQKVSFQLNFSARIQLYLNLTFSAPLVVISILIITILNSNSKENIKNTYFRQAESISGNIIVELESFYKGLRSIEELLETVIQTSRLTQTDINLFDKNGFLLVSSQPFIYESDLLAKLINPNAMESIDEKGQNKIMLTESVGQLDYKSVYMGVKSYETSELRGIISIPFFESQKRSEKEIIEVLSTIINVFTLIFLALIVLSYIASHFLTAPLQMLTQKISLTTLNNTNEPLDYHSTDEIGVLVGAYNNMLLQLEESKLALSKSEKESAWREMARQVAHEIKNPLTPMKLTLQHLQRVLSSENPRAGRSIESLLGQIDTLSDIATSFSAFANMPIPKNEEFDVAHTLRQTVNLYKNDEKAQISSQISEKQIWIMGDEKLMSRIFTNLIINGIQSVPSQRKAKIQISLYVLSGKVRIEIADNGSGIEENIQQKVFLPNFSTKFTGSGIGLAIAKRGIEHGGGQIWFETQISLGTVFIIEMPLLPN